MNKTTLDDRIKMAKAKKEERDNLRIKTVKKTNSDERIREKTKSTVVYSR